MNDAKSIISRYWINILNIISQNIIVIIHIESQYLRSKGKKRSVPCRNTNLSASLICLPRKSDGMGKLPVGASKVVFDGIVHPDTHHSPTHWG
jgi:hypothetical protein